MKAIYIKELKENVNWAVLMLLGLSIAMWVAVSISEHNIFVNESVFVVTLGCFSAAGLTLGLLEIFQDQWKGRYAFVMHRPISPSTIFWGKVLAGLTLYIPMTAIPFFAGASWAAAPGNIAAPFDWHMTLPGIWDLINGLSWYFAGMLIGSRRARWLGSRIMPLGWPVFFTALGFYRASSLGEALVITGISLLVLVPAAWGGFVHSVAPNRQPGIIRVCQTLVVTVGIFVALIAACAFVSEELGIFIRPSSGSYSWYVIDKTGRPLRIEYISDHDVSNVYDLEGKLAGTIQTGSNWAQELRMTFIQLPAERRGEMDVPRYRFHMAERYATELYGLEQENWYYLTDQKTIVGYYARSHRRIGHFGADGFVPAPQSAQPLSFPLSLGSYWNNSPFYDRMHVYTLNLATRQIQTILTTTADDPVLYVNTFNEGSDDEFERGARANSLREQYVVVSTEKKLHVLRNSEELFSFVRPVSRPDYSGLYMGKMTNGPYILRGYSWGEGAAPQRVMELNDQGTVVKQIELPPLAVIQSTLPWWRAALMGIAMSPVMYLGLRLISYVNGLSDNQIPEIYYASMAFAVLAAVLTLLYARRHTLTTRARAVWGIFTLFFGTSGLLGMISMREKPARVRCPSCGKLRIVTRESCEHCNAAFAPPPVEGIEIVE